jgi:hypothetical protein
MTAPQEDLPPRYVVIESDRFADDKERAVLSFNGRLGPQPANAWYKRLLQVLDDLTGFPGPLSHARDEDATDHYGREVRRLLYYGPTRKRSGTPVCVLFTILPPDPAAPPEEAESVIFLLRLLHSAQRLLPEDES